jgi:predicted nucleic acid-binding protein
MSRYWIARAINISFYLGETEVLAWAYENPGHEVILADRAARNCALSLNLPVHGTISVLLLAKRTGHLKELTPILFQSEPAGFRIDPTMISATKKLTKKINAAFFSPSTGLIITTALLRLILEGQLQEIHGQNDHFPLV